jgi:Phasin protein
MREEVERATHETAEEAARVGREQIQAGQRTAQAGVDLLQTGLEVFQRNVELTMGLIKDVSERNIRGGSELLGEEAQKGALQSARGEEAMAATLSELSSDWMRIVQSQTQRNMAYWTTLMGCRTPQDLLNAQSSLLRDNLEDAWRMWQVVANRSSKLGGTLARNAEGAADRRRG